MNDPHSIEIVEYGCASHRVFLRRLMILPFETALALTAVWVGVSSILGLPGVAGQALNAALPMPIVVSFNLLYIVAGVLMILGLGWGYRKVEATGLILFITSVAVRVMMLLIVFRWGQGAIVTPIMQSLFFAVAAASRLYVVVKKGTLMQFNGRVSVE